MPPFGENLRRERELREISLRDIAEKTKISVRFLQAIEQDRWDVLPGGVFPRAFIRQYAHFLGLDADRVLADYVRSREGEEPVLPEPSPTRRPSAASRAVPLVLLSAGAALVLWLVPGSKESPETAVPLPSPPSSAAPSADRVYPPPELNNATSLGQSETLTLTLSAEQSCWVSVEVDGEVVLDRVLSRGETRTLEAESEIVLSVGNAGGLSFKVNDQPGVPLGHSGEVRRNIVINSRSLPSLVEDPQPGLQSS
jgi:cytoskeletal protein RodZ